MEPIQIPTEWDDHGLITFEEFCTLIRIPQRTARDWRQRGVGPRWARLQRLRTALHHRCRSPPLPTVGDARRARRHRSAPSQGDLPWLGSENCPSTSASKRRPR